MVLFPFLLPLFYRVSTLLMDRGSWQAGQEMAGDIASHYTGDSGLVIRISNSLRRMGKQLDELTTDDLATVDEFHIRGRSATIELADQLSLNPEKTVLDIGSGLGGPARTVAKKYGCAVTGIDLTPEFCETAKAMTDWVGLAGRVGFMQGDATDLPFDDNEFDAAMTLHVAMNIADKSSMYAEAKRVLRPGGRFGVYDILKGEGGDVHFPVPWARTPEISHLASPSEMQALLTDAGFTIVNVSDSSAESLEWFKEMAARLAQQDAPALSFSQFLGDDFPQMAKNQVRNLKEDRIRTCTFVCEA